MRTGIFKTYSIEEIITWHWFFFQHTIYFTHTTFWPNGHCAPLTILSEFNLLRPRHTVLLGLQICGCDCPIYLHIYKTYLSIKDNLDIRQSREASVLIGILLTIWFQCFKKFSIILEKSKWLQTLWVSMLWRITTIS